MELAIRNQQNTFDVRHLRSLLQEVMETAFQRLGASSAVELVIVLTDDASIRTLNRDFRGNDASTDVLSFPQQDNGPASPAGELPVLGDIVVSLETAQRQAAEYGHSVDREVGYLAVHGLLHLMGFDHESDEGKKRMRSWEKDIMQACQLLRER